MSEYIQVGATAMRDPLTGEFLPAVPLFIRESDAAAAAPLNDMNIAEVFAEKFRQYQRECKKRGERSETDGKGFDDGGGHRSGARPDVDAGEGLGKDDGRDI